MMKFTIEDHATLNIGQLLFPNPSYYHDGLQLRSKMQNCTQGKIAAKSRSRLCMALIKKDQFQIHKS